ncbi:MAG: class I SAM-dependent methyltransferase [Armatimonadota bacterium]
MADEHADGMVTPPQCPLCSGTRLQRWFCSADGRWVAWGCEECDLWFVWPPESGTAGCDPSGRSFFESAEYLETVDGAYVASRKQHLKRFRTILSRAVQQLESPQDLSSIRAADVGCGVGTSVAAMESLGMEATGCDFSRPLIQRGRDMYPALDLKCGVAGDLKDATYHLISAFNIVEHIRDVRGFIATLREKLVSGGLLVIETPDRYSLFQRVLAAVRRMGSIHHTLSQDGGHIYLFSRRALEYLLAQHDFVIEDTWTTMSPYEELAEKTRRRKGLLASAVLGGVYALSCVTGLKNRRIVVARKT